MQCKEVFCFRMSLTATPGRVGHHEQFFPMSLDRPKASTAAGNDSHSQSGQDHPTCLDPHQKIAQL